MTTVEPILPANGATRRMAMCPSIWLVAAVWAATAVAAHAQPAPFPTGTIRLVAPVSASTPPDIISRIVARELSEDEGWKVVVENRPGGVTTIAAGDVLVQPADGQSLFAMTLTTTVAQSLVPNIRYHVDADFDPVVKVAVSYNVLVVNPSVPATTVAELVALLKSQPDRLTFSSGGFGTPAHLIGEAFKLQTGTSAQHVPYAQFPQAIGDLLNGTNTFMFITMLPVIDLIKTGKLRALAVTSPKRVAVLPDVPTIGEAGFPLLVVEDWSGFSVKHGTPKDVVLRLNGAINTALAHPSVRDAFAKIGAVPAGGTSAEFGQLVVGEVAHWAGIVTGAGMKLQ
jgi:tripartite-type tricarboxylate transporter receptor subunit TctC